MNLPLTMFTDIFFMAFEYRNISNQQPVLVSIELPWWQNGEVFVGRLTEVHQNVGAVKTSWLLKVDTKSMLAGSCKPGAKQSGAVSFIELLLERHETNYNTNAGLILFNTFSSCCIFASQTKREIPWKEDVWIFLPNGLSHICQWGFSHESHPGQNQWDCSGCNPSSYLFSD